MLTAKAHLLRLDHQHQEVHREYQAARKLSDARLALSSGIADRGNSIAEIHEAAGRKDSRSGGRSSNGSPGLGGHDQHTISARLVEEEHLQHAYQATSNRSSQIASQFARWSACATDLAMQLKVEDVRRRMLLQQPATGFVCAYVTFETCKGAEMALQLFPHVQAPYSPMAYLRTCTSLAIVRAS